MILKSKLILDLDNLEASMTGRVAHSDFQFKKKIKNRFIFQSIVHCLNEFHLYDEFIFNIPYLYDSIYFQIDF